MKFNNMQWGWRLVNPDLTSRNGYRWPFPGKWAESSGPYSTSDNPCPQWDGDGICIARTFNGARSGGISGWTGLIVGFKSKDLLAEADDKVRVKRAFVLDVIDVRNWLVHPHADLRYADLRYADLGYADLGYADLRYANLRSADLGYADLRYANLGYANLRYADLWGATYNQLTLWPAGFDLVSAKAVKV